jgi:succinate dehydrogenase / fumarate reductase flavoprotein subunit
LRAEFWKDVKVLGSKDEFNINLEAAGRVADFLEFAELFAYDALMRDESCGGHFREEHQTEEGEARRVDEKFAYAAAWEYKGVGENPVLHKDNLEFEHVKYTQRSYK